MATKTRQKTEEMSPVNGQISASERQQLVRLVKMKTADILAEIEEIFADEMAQIDTEIARRFVVDDRRLDQLARELDEITAAANHKAAEVFDQYADLVSPSSTRRESYSRPYYNRLDHRREEARRGLTATIHAKRVRARQRAQAHQTKLIEELTLGALHSEAAKAFVLKMPTAEELLEAAAQPRQLEGTQNS